MPSKTIHCKRGVRQGDPLFVVLVADFLKVVINMDKAMGLLHLLSPIQSNQDFLVIQYVDDTLLIMEGCQKQLFFMKTLLQNFSESTALRVNYSKSLMLPINMTEQRFVILARTFGCSEGSLPFTYLGLPLGTTKPRIQEFLPLVNKYERRLGGISTFLNFARRL